MIYTVYRKRGEPGFLNRIGAPEFLCQPLDMDRLTDVVTFGASLSREKKRRVHLLGAFYKEKLLISFRDQFGKDHPNTSIKRQAKKINKGRNLNSVTIVHNCIPPPCTKQHARARCYLRQ